MKILNLNEGSFPIELSMVLDELDIPNFGKLINNLKFEAEINKISKNLYKCDGTISGDFSDQCQNCLNLTTVEISSLINVAIKDIAELHLDSSEQDQTHYQDLEYFNIQMLIEEEIVIAYPDIVKCDKDCLENNDIEHEEKNFPFKKIRDLME